MRPAILIALLMFSCACAARAETVLGVGGLAVEGRIVELDDARRLVVETGRTEAGTRRVVRVPLDDVVEIHYGRAAASEGGAAVSVAPRTILFENGDRLEGDIACIENERLVVVTRRLGRLSVPLVAVRGVLHPRQGVSESINAAARAAIETGEAAAEDVLFLANGDQSVGVIVKLGNGRVEMDHLALGKRVVVDLHDVIALRFARLPGAKEPAPSVGVVATLGTADGSRLSGPLLCRLDREAAHRVARRRGTEGRALGAGARPRTRLVPRGTARLALGPRAPRARGDAAPGPAFCAGPRPAARRRRALDRRPHLPQRARDPLTQPVHRALDGVFETFESYIGIDDETGGAGSVAGSGEERNAAVRGEGCVVFRVLVDGKEKYNSGAVRGGEAARYVRVSLTGAKEIMLCVDEDEELDLADLADWAEPHLVRPKGKESKE